jgi:hypothetical protein
MNNTLIFARDFFGGDPHRNFRKEEDTEEQFQTRLRMQREEMAAAEERRKREDAERKRHLEQMREKGDTAFSRD